MALERPPLSQQEDTVELQTTKNTYYVPYI